MLNIFSYTCWLSVCLLWENSYSVFLPIFEIQLFVSLTLSYMNLIYFWISTPNQTLHLQRAIYSNAANFVLFGFDYGLPFSRLHFPFVDGFLQFCLTFSCSVAFHSLLPHGLQHYPSLSFTISQSLLKLMSIELMMPSNHVILCCPLLLPPSICPRIRVFSNESVLHIRWPKYQNFSFSISSSNEYLGLIFFRIDWLDLLFLPGTLKSLLQLSPSL